MLALFVARQLRAAVSHACNHDSCYMNVWLVLIEACVVSCQAKHAELEELQGSLSSDAAKLNEQLTAFEARREAAVKELQVGDIY